MTKRFNEIRNNKIRNLTKLQLAINKFVTFILDSIEQNSFPEWTASLNRVAPKTEYIQNLRV